MIGIERCDKHTCESVWKNDVEQMGQLSKQSHGIVAQTLHGQLSEIQSDGDAWFSAIEARITALENNNNSSNNDNVSKKEDHDQEDQRSTRAVATGFNKELSEEGTMKFLRHVVREVEMKYETKDIFCPAKPITHAFLQIVTTRDRNAFIRSANRRKYTKDDRSIRLTPDMSLEERYLQHRLAYIKFCLDEKYRVQKTDI